MKAKKGLEIDISKIRGICSNMHLPPPEQRKKEMEHLEAWLNGERPDPPETMKPRPGDEKAKLPEDPEIVKKFGGLLGLYWRERKNKKKIPKSTTLRKYYPDSILTDEELSELERFYCKEMGISWIKPDRN